MILKEQLIAARALIDKPEKWTKGTYARDVFGEPTAVYDKAATCYCISGTLLALSIHSWRLEELLGNAVPKNFKTRSKDRRHVRYNDHPETTHADIMALFDRAIEAAE